jgi:hypothetical protein
MHAALIQASEKAIKNQRNLNAIGGYVVVLFKQKKRGKTGIKHRKIHCVSV